jgi:hypothetical protein
MRSMPYRTAGDVWGQLRMPPTRNFNPGPEGGVSDLHSKLHRNQQRPPRVLKRYAHQL